MSRNFSSAALMEFAPQMVQKMQAMLEKLNELAGDSIDMYHWLHRFGLEIVCK